MKDPLTEFVEQSHQEPGPRAELQMSKAVGDAGFRLKCRGGQKAIDKLAARLNDIDLSEDTA